MSTDPLRMRVPTWRCMICPEKFHTRAEFDAHLATHRAQPHAANPR